MQTSKYRTPQASRRHIIAILKRHKTIGPEIPWIHGLVGRPKMALCRLMSPCARDCTLEAARITANGGATEPLASVDNRRASARSPSAPHPAPPRVPPTRTPPRSLRTPRHAQRRAIHRGAHPPPRPGHRLDKRSSRGRACDGARPRAPTAKTAERKRDKLPQLSCGSVWCVEAGRVRVIERPISRRYISQDDRIEIAEGLSAGESVKVIAARIGKSYQSVYREIARNRKGDGTYQPWYAHNQAPLLATSRCRRWTSTSIVSGGSR